MPIEHQIQTFKEIYDTEYPYTEVIGKGILASEEKLLVAGPPKHGKSLLMMQTAAELANGKPWLQSVYVPEPQKILMFALEDTGRRLHQRQHLMALEMGEKALKTANVTVVRARAIPFMTDEGQEFVDKLVRKYNPDGLIIDPFYKINVADENAAHIVQQTFNVIDSAIAINKSWCILVHHTHKIHYDKHGNPISEGMNAIRGSIQFWSWPDSIAVLSRNKEDVWLDCSFRDSDITRIDLAQDKNSLLYTAETMYSGSSQIANTALGTHVQQLRQIMKGLGWSQVTQIVEKSGLHKTLVYECLSQMESSGQAERKHSEKDARISLWRVV